MKGFVNMPNYFETNTFRGADSTTAGWPLNSGSGERKHRATIKFSKQFYAPPKVMASISMFDITQGTNHRLKVSAENIKVDSFDIVLETWYDTKVFAATASWLAFGVAPEA